MGKKIIDNICINVVLSGWEKSMDFIEFVEKLRTLKERGWEICVIDQPCPNHPDDHCHLVLRFREPGTGGLLTPVEAVSQFLYGNKNREFEYNDPDISLNGIAKAANYVDWLRGGYIRYVEARLAMLEVLGISEQSIRERAPHSRSVGRP